MEKILMKILGKLENMEGDISEIKEEQQAMKNDISEMRKDISRMEKDIARIDTDMSGMKSDMSGMKKRQEESYLIITAILERTNINSSLEENISIVKAENEKMFYQMNEYVRKDKLLEELKKAL